MSSQFLSLGWVLALTIAFFGQRLTAYPQNPYYVEGSGESGPRGHWRHHHGHHDHGYHNNNNWPAHGPVGVPDTQPLPTGHYPRNPYNQIPGGFRQPGGFFEGGQGFRPQPGPGYAPDGGFNRGQPGFRFPPPGNNYSPQYPRPGSEESFNPRQPGFNQPAYPRPGQIPGNSPTYPRPGQFPGGFQQPEGEENSSPNQPGFQSPDGNRGQPGNQPTYPRPGGGRLQPLPGGFQQPDSEERLNAGQLPNGSRGQPGNQQPGGNSSPNYPFPGSGGTSFQSGPSQGGSQPPAGSGENIFQQSRPNPSQAPSGFPSRGQTPGNQNTLQPRPGNEEDFTQFNFQSPHTLQPRPGQDEFAGRAGSPGNTLQPIPGGQKTQGTVIQPKPGQSPTPENVDSSLSDIFKTNEFLSPELNSPGGSGIAAQADPKSDATDINPESVNERNLFDTEPHCKDGTELMSKRCRKTA
ncbi:hypothetical protein KR026_001749 [Drosophila bipectinata]|nr:hypothetical protein KR026_001749 [Drosophila bipectinata]